MAIHSGGFSFVELVFFFQIFNPKIPDIIVIAVAIIPTMGLANLLMASSIISSGGFDFSISIKILFEYIVSFILCMGILIGLWALTLGGVS